MNEIIVFLVILVMCFLLGYSLRRNDVKIIEPPKPKVIHVEKGVYIEIYVEEMLHNYNREKESLVRYEIFLYVGSTKYRTHSHNKIEGVNMVLSYYVLNYVKTIQIKVEEDETV